MSRLAKLETTAERRITSVCGWREIVPRLQTIKLLHLFDRVLFTLSHSFYGRLPQRRGMTNHPMTNNTVLVFQCTKSESTSSSFSTEGPYQVTRYADSLTK